MRLKSLFLINKSKKDIIKIMNEDKRSGELFSSILKAFGFLLVLFLLLCVITSMVTGISMFDPKILDAISGVFKIALIVLGILIIGIFTVAIMMGRNVNVAGKSTLIKDNALRYEYIDNNGRIKKKTFSLKNIDEYLKANGEMQIVDNYRIFKKNKTDRINANTLYVEGNDKKKMNMHELNNADEKQYYRLCVFLDSISELSPRMITERLADKVYASNIILEGKNVIQDLVMAKKEIDDVEVKQEIDKTINRINENEVFISDGVKSNSQRKLYEHYLPMLVEISNNYLNLEKHDKERKDLQSAKIKLLETFRLICSAFDSLSADSSERQLDELEATVTTMNALLSQDRASK